MSFRNVMKKVHPRISGCVSRRSLRLKFECVIFAFAIIATSSSGGYSDSLRAPDFTLTVTGISPHGEIIFEDGRLVRLWGVYIDDPKNLAFLLGKDLKCFYVHRSLKRLRGPTALNAAAHCYSVPLDHFDGRTLHEYLFSLNLAKEHCAETRNALKNCEKINDLS